MSDNACRHWFFKSIFINIIYMKIIGIISVDRLDILGVARMFLWGLSCPVEST